MISRSGVFVRDEVLSEAEGRTGDMTGNPIRIWMVDDNETFRSLLAELLAYEEDFDCSRQFPSAEAVLEALPQETPPDVILLDIRMGGQSGLDAVRPIKLLSPSTTVLMLTTFFDSYARARAIRDGAADLLLKSYGVQEIAQRIRQAHGRRGEEISESPEAVSAAVCSEHFRNEVAGELKARRSDTDEAGQSCQETISRNRSWRHASNRLARGVTYLRSLLKAGGVASQSNDVSSSLGSGREIDCVSE
jgi:DNA-binding NarL/FixJ family response regulator